MKSKLLDRKTLLAIFILAIFLIIFFRLADITVIKGEYYRKKADDSFLKRVNISAKRGEIYDVNGKLLAGNVSAYSVKFLNLHYSREKQNKIIVDLLTLLEKNNEKYLEFPIIKTEDGYEYISDTHTKKWLLENGFGIDKTAEEVFETIRKREYIDDDLDKYDAQQILLYKGIMLPISVKQMKFLNEIGRDNFLEYYGLDPDISAKEAFYKLKEHDRFKIDESYNDDEALKIMTVRHAFNQQGYMSYIPIEIAKDVSEKTAILIQEMKMDFPEISIEVDSKRYYPYKDTLAHMIGYMGRISSENEIKKYSEEAGYSKNDLIGKTGTENYYEDILHGVDGYKYIYVDALGNYIGDVVEGIEGQEPKNSKSGENIKYTVDIEFQKYVEYILEYGIKKIQEGGIYKSKFGNIKMKESKQTESGAAVVVDVNTGKILALANYPRYDLNLFANGISFEDWQSLQPKNPRNPLGSRPLYNIATNTAVAPGSTYKMLTVLTAIEKGLDPYKKIYANGVIEIGKQLYRCWLYKSYLGRHGPIDAIKALEVSCNYYMFCISRGYDYLRNKSLGYEIDTKDLLEMSKKFGLGEKSGLEIAENPPGLPSEEIKKQTQVYALRRFLNSSINEYFKNDLMSEEEFENNIDEIISWADEYLDSTLSRNDVIKRLGEMSPESEYNDIVTLADQIYFNYFKQIPWREGDDFNLSIGQGDHRYTPLQMAKYIAAIANGGTLYDLSIISEISGTKIIKVGKEIKLNDKSNIDIIKKGMYLVAHGKKGSARRIFENFPINVAAKTGTAQAQGRVQPVDELEFLKNNFKKIIDNAGTNDMNFEDIQNEAKEIIINRYQEIFDLYKKMNKMEEGSKKEEIKTEIKNKLNGSYTNEASVMKEIMIQKSEENITYEMIEEIKNEYEPFSWFVSFAPYENPEIAVVVLIPQGAQGSNSAPIVRDIYAKYFELYGDYKYLKQ